MTPRDHSHSRSVGRGVKLEISTVVHVKSLGNISPLRPASIRPDMLRGGSLDILLRNADIATVPLAVKKTFQVWSELLSGTNKTSARRQVLPTSLAMLIFVKERFAQHPRLTSRSDDSTAFTCFARSMTFKVSAY